MGHTMDNKWHYAQYIVNNENIIANVSDGIKIAL